MCLLASLSAEGPRGQKRKRDGDEGDDDWNFPTTLLHLFILTCRVIKICTAYFYIIFLCFALSNHCYWTAKHKIITVIETKWWKQAAFAVCFWVVPHSLNPWEWSDFSPFPHCKKLHKKIDFIMNFVKYFNSSKNEINLIYYPPWP